MTTKELFERGEGLIREGKFDQALLLFEAIMAKAVTKTEQLWAKKHIADIESREERNNGERARTLYREILDEACCDPELVQWCLLDLDRIRKKLRPS